MRSRSESHTPAIHRDLALKVVYNFNKLLKSILPQNPFACRKNNRAHKLLSPRPPLPAIPTRNTFIRYCNQTYTWRITCARNSVVWPDSFRVLDTITQRNWS